MLRYDTSLFDGVASLPAGALRHLPLHKLGGLACAFAATGRRPEPFLDRLAARAEYKIRQGMALVVADDEQRGAAHAGRRAAALALRAFARPVLQLPGRRKTAGSGETHTTAAEPTLPAAPTAAGERQHRCSARSAKEAARHIGRTINVTGLARLALGYARLRLAHRPLFGAVGSAAAALMRSGRFRPSSRHHGALVAALAWAFVSQGLYHRCVADTHHLCVEYDGVHNYRILTNTATDIPLFSLCFLFSSFTVLSESLFNPCRPLFDELGCLLRTDPKIGYLLDGCDLALLVWAFRTARHGDTVLMHRLEARAATRVRWETWNDGSHACMGAVGSMHLLGT